MKINGNELNDKDVLESLKYNLTNMFTIETNIGMQDGVFCKGGHLEGTMETDRICKFLSSTDITKHIKQIVYKDTGIQDKLPEDLKKLYTELNEFKRVPLPMKMYQKIVVGGNSYNVCGIQFYVEMVDGVAKSKVKILYDIKNIKRAGIECLNDQLVINGYMAERQYIRAGENGVIKPIVIKEKEKQIAIDCAHMYELEDKKWVSKNMDDIKMSKKLKAQITEINSILSIYKNKMGVFGLCEHYEVELQ